MGIIHVLSPQMANLIAAGEVVERPGSVVKEIIENAVDAGSSRIEVEIKNGGVTYIRVSDNGCGMEADDVPTAFLRHATSKIRNPEDMQAIGTMGFRGEALAAISSVAKVDIFTRTEKNISGVQMTCEGGEVTGPTETGCPKGTTVVIRDLFYNVPARMKFLKKDATEASYCENAVVSAALANPHISFKFIKDGRESFFSPGSGDLLQVINALCGRETAGALLPVRGSFPEVELQGYVSPVTETRSSRSMQYFLVNGRPVRGKILSAALDGAYKGRIMPGRHPVCFLNLRVPLSAVDVNVHPAKLEVKFVREKEVFSAIHNAVTLALDGANAFPDMQLPEDKPAEAPAPVSKAETEKPQPAVHLPGFEGLRIESSELGRFVGGEGAFASGGLYNRASKPGLTGGESGERKITHASHSEPFEFDESMFTINKTELIPPRKGVSAFDKREGSKLEIPGRRPEPEAIPAEAVDAILSLATIVPAKEKPAPAASEPAAEPPVQETMYADEEPADAAETRRVLEKTEGGLQVIGMLFNTYIIAQEKDSMWLIDKHAAHEKLIYNELTANLGAQDIQTLLRPVSVNLTPAEKQACLDNLEVLEKCGFEVDDLGFGGLAVRGAPTYLAEQDIPFVLSEMAEKLAAGFEAENTVLGDLLASISCKAAIKGGSYSDLRELQLLAEKVLSLPDVRNCPHGRPVAVCMTRYQLEKQFKRVL